MTFFIDKNIDLYMRHQLVEARSCEAYSSDITMDDVHAVKILNPKGSLIYLMHFTVNKVRTEKSEN